MASTGVGLARAERTAGDLLDALQVGALVGMGVCGGLSPDLAAGAVVVGEEVWGPSGKASPDPAWLRRARNTRVEPGILMSVPAIASSRETKSRLLAELPPGAVAGVDMESAAWARAAEARGVPHLVLRIVLDPAGEELPKVLESCQDGEGGLRRGYVAREALLHPEIIPALVSLDRRMRSSAGSLAEALLAVLAETPSPGER
jgi:nucleoside phosphorylase